MFRILVADDEKVTRKGIVTMLERGLKEEIEFIEAANGEEALQIVKQQMIHLVITDICMPLCSGLEFVEQLRRNDDDVTVIIVSGYENFEYAKQAVRLGVKDYIMKPLKREELLGLVENCIADIRKKQMEMQQFWQQTEEQNRLRKELEHEVLLHILHGMNVQVGIARLEFLKRNFTEPFLIAAVLAYEWNPESDAQVEASVKRIVEEALEARLAGNACSMCEEHGKIVLAAGLSEMKKQVCVAADCKIFNTGEKVISFAGIPGCTGAEACSVDSAGGEKKVLEAFQKMFAAGKSIETVQMLRKMYDKIRQECNQRQKSSDSYVGKAFSELWSDFELRREVKEMMQYAADTDSEDAAKKSQMIKDITAFVRAHVTEDIDLNYVAEMFGKTPGYIGMLFRRENGLGFNEFVTSERIELAKKLLKDSSVSVQKVGEKCGYYNPKYFSIVFKKAEGISPKAYQMMQKRED